MKSVRTPRSERLGINEVIPYWRNPRRLTSEAVEAVSQSIKQYGYAQPIVVDEDNVIIIGHTRYAALRRLQVEQVDVEVVDYLDAQKVKQLRIIDNKAGEFSFWDFDKLLEEAAEADSELLDALFPETVAQDEITLDAQITELTQGDAEDEVDTEVEFVCPSCFNEWIVDVTREDIMSGTITPKESK